MRIEGFSRLVERFTAERDELLVRIQECQERVTDLVQRLGVIEGPSGDASAPAPHVQEIRAAVEESAESARHHAAEALRTVAREPRFLEAITWQNRRAIHTAIEPLLRAASDAHDARIRDKQHLLASYLQRYCVKNDSIGFFGPVGWAMLDDSVATTVLSPGRSLIAGAQVGESPPRNWPAA